MGSMRNAFRILVRKPDGKRQLGRLRRRWDEVRKGIKEMMCEDFDWTTFILHRRGSSSGLL
jgi:hypothetical protein